MKVLSFGILAGVGLVTACSEGSYSGSPDTETTDATTTTSTTTPSPVVMDGGVVEPTDGGSPVSPAPVTDDGDDEDASVPPAPSPQPDASVPMEVDAGETDDSETGLPPLPPPCGGLCDEGQVCDLATDECVECLNDGQCGEGLECRENTCEEIVTCDSSETCPAELGVCHSQLDRCVECEIDLDCPDGQSCESRVCVGEASSSECAMGQDVCSSKVVAPLKGTQVLDGRGDEFCEIPGFELNFQNAARGNSNLPQRAEVRVAWTKEAFHFFAEVTDPEVVTNAEIEYLWSGDVVELFLAPQAANELEGFFSGRVDGVQILFAPPTAQHPARAARLFWLPNTENPESYVQVREPMTSGFVSRLTNTGYAVEARLPWSMFGPRTPEIESGSQIAFDVGLSTANAQTIGNPNDGREGAAVLYAGPTTNVNTCTGDQVPWCNSTTWCSPELVSKLPAPPVTDAGM